MRKIYSTLFNKTTLGFVAILFCSVIKPQSGNSQVTQSFVYTGSDQTFTVPAGVSSVTVKIWGAGGGNASWSNLGGSGGSGSYVGGTLSVAGGQVLHIAVGGGGKTGPNSTTLGGAGGWPTGGSGGLSSNRDNGGGGGGYSGLFSSATYTQGVSFVLAGAGGGGGGYFNNDYASGGGGGTDGFSGNSAAAGATGAGKAGTAGAGGAGGVGTTTTGSVGSALTGGAGASGVTWIAGGGGGAGYYGGGGGGSTNSATALGGKNWGGGGGGSSYTTNASFTVTTNTNGNSSAGTTGGTANPPNTGDVNYQAGVGVGPAGSGASIDGGNGLVVITYTLPSITTGTITGSPFCSGALVSVPFTSIGTYTTNTYTAQLSDAAGSFAAPTTIGTLVSNANSGTVPATIPAATPSGAGYRIRVISSNPVVTGTNNGVNLTVTALPTITSLSYNGSPYCTSLTTASPSLTASSNSGTYSYTVVSGGPTLSLTASNGVINPSISSAGTYTVTYTIVASGGCAAVTKSASVTITALPVATFSYAGTPYCQNAADPSPTFSGGGVAGTFSSTGGLVFVSTSTGQINLSASTPGTYTVTNTIVAANGCGAVTATSPITITALPVAAFSYTGTPYCQNAANPSPTFSGGGVAGAFSSTAGLVFVSTSTGQINLSGSTPGTYTVTNVIAAANGCAAVTATSSVTITALPVATFSYTTTPYCQDGTNPSPTFSGGGVAGTFSSTGGLAFVSTSTGQIDLSASTPGTYTVTNTIAASAGCAIVTATSSITIYQPVAITGNPTPASSTLCTNGTINYTVTATGSNLTYQWKLNGNPISNGGDFSGATSATLQITGADPTDAGNYTVTVSGSAPCTSLTSTPISLTVNQNIGFTTQPVANTTLCQNQTFTISASVTGTVTSYQWYKNGSPYAPGTVSGNTYTLSIPGITGADAGTYKLFLDDGTGTGCPSAFSGTAVLNVSATSVGGTVSSNASVCNGTNSGTLTLSGQTGNVIGWEYSTDGGTTWTSISNTTTSQTYNNLTQTTLYRVVAQSGVCPSDNATPATITVYNVLTAGTVAADQTICYNTAPAPFTSTTLPTGGNGSYTYQWQSAAALAGPYTNIAGATSTTYAPPALTATTYYRRTETSGGGCGIVNSNVITITVYANLTAGTVAAAQTICYNTAPAPFTSATLPTGGTGSYTYQWQSSPDNATWTDIPGATLTTYTAGTLTITTYYRRNATSGTCGTVSSASIKITVNPILVAGTVAASQTICYNTAPAPFTSATLPTGGTGSYIYQWQSSPDNITFTNIAGATATTYTSGVLTTTTYFRRNETSGTCGTVTSNVLTVTVYANLTAGTVAANQTICYNTAPVPFTSTTLPTGGNGSYTYQWQSSPNGVSAWASIGGATSTTYAPPALTATTYYRRTETSGGGCGAVNSNVITVTVYAVLTSGTVAAAQTICYNTAPAPFTSTALPTGGTGTYTYQWQSSPDNATWTDVSGATLTTYTAGILTTTTYFRRNATSGTCGTVSSASIKITVNPNLVAGTVAASQTICYNTAPAQFTNATAPTGGTGSYTYQWQSSTDNITFNNIPSATNPTYTSGALTVTTYFRRNETSGTCGTVTSNVLTVTVYANLTAGTVAANQTICYNTAPVPFTSTTLPTGGNGSYTYQWQSSPNGVSAWASIGGATSTTYAPPALTATTYYRRTETSGGGCGAVNSNVITVTVYAVLTSGTVAAAQTICYNTAPAPFTSTALPTGGTGTYTYQWQSSPDNATWTDVSGATLTTYTAGILTTTTYFRRNATSGTCGTVSSASIKITVNPNLVAGTVAASQTICYNTAPAQFTNATTPTGGTGSYTYQWQSSTDNITFNNIPSATNPTYTSGALTVTTYFRRNETSGTCGTVTSNVLTVTVYANLTAGTVAANQTICYNTAPVPFTSTTLPTGGNGSYTYQWQSSPNGVSAWASIGGATSTTYAPPALTATTYYRRTETSGGGCGAVNSNVITVTVYAVLTSGTVAAAQTICYNTAPAPFTSTALPTGGTGTYTYQWQSSPDNATWTDVSGATLTTYTAGILTTTTYFRRNATSGTCGTVSSASIKITVNPNLVAGTVAASQTICYNTAPAQFTNATAPTGGTGSYTYQWQSSTDNITFNNIPSATNPTYTSGALTVTTYFRRNETSGTCGTVTSNVLTVTVNPLPVVSITGPNPICAGFTTTLSPASGGTWISNNTSVATVNSSTGVVTGVATVTGTATFTFTETSTGCVNTTLPLTVNALPTVAPITDGATSICVNGITNFNDATTGGTWSIIPGTGTASIDNTGLVTGLSAGTVTVVYTYSNGTCTNSVSTPLTIDALPPISPIGGGATTVCINANTPPFTDATSGGTWSIINGTGSASILPSGVVTGLTAGTVTVLYSTFNGQCSNEAAKSLTVKPLPTVAVIGGGVASICENSVTPAFTDATSGGTWSIINGTGTATISVGGVVTPSSPGTVTVAYTVTGGGCSNTATKPLTINAIPVIAPIAGGASSVCLNASTVAFTDATGGGVWSINTGTGTASITAGGVVTGLSVGTVTVVYTVTSGSCSDFVTAPLTVNALPVAGAITGPSAVCVGSTINLTSNASGAGSLSYTWTSSNTFFATVSNTGVVTGVAAGTPNITYTVTDANGCSSTSPAYPVIVNARPTANITLANTAICKGSSINITGTVTGNGAWTLTLSNGGTATGSGNGTFSISVTPLINTTYTITSLADVNCNSIAGDLTGSVTITVNDPVVIGTQPSDVTVCATLPADLTVSATGSGLTYQWYRGIAPGGTIVTNTANISGATTADLHFNQSGTSDDADYYVIITGLTPCAPVPSGPAHLTVSTTINISAQPASQTICSGSDVTFSVTATTAVGNLLYQWRKNGSVIPGAIFTTYTITGATAADAGNYDVVITGIGGCTTAFSTVAVLTIDPLSVGGTVSSSAAECSGNNSATLNLTGQTGAVINWESSPDGTTWTTVAPANMTTSLTYTNLTSVTYYRAVVKSGVCLPANSAAAIITIKPIPDAIATPAAQNKCSGNPITTIVLSSGVSGTTFAWTRNNNATVSGILASGSGDISGTLVNTTTAPITVTFTITPTASGCVGTPITATVIVNPVPNAVATPSNQSICSGPITTIVLSGNIPLTTYNWTRNQPAVTGIPASGSGDISGSLTNTSNALVMVTFTITPTVGGCPGTSITATVGVKPTPTVSATNTTQTMCSGVGITTINISSSNGVAGTTFSWTRDNTTNITGLASGSGTPISGILTNTTNAQQITVFTISATAGGCSSSTPATITVNPKPAMTNIAALTICNKSTVGIGLTSTVPSTYTWQANANYGNVTGESFSSQQASGTISDFLTNTSAALPYNSGTNTPGLTPRQTVIYSVIPTSNPGGCTGATQLVSVTVNPVYNATFVTPMDINTLTICDGDVLDPTQNDIDLLTGDYRGSTLLWQYSIGSPGPWSPMIGPFPNNEKSDTFPDPPSVLSPIGTYYFRLLVDACSTDTLVLTKTSTLTINAGPDNTVCESGSPAAIPLSGSTVGGTATTTVGGTWSITSLVPGNGAIQGTLSSTAFRTPAQIPLVNYTPPPNYTGTITLTLTSNDPDGNGTCVPLTQTRVINVTQAPIISNPFAMSICSGTGTNINLTSAIPSTFTWSVGTVTGGITGATPTSGSGAIINQVLTNPSTSTAYTVQYNVTPTPNPPYSGCAAVTSTIVVTVTPSPAINLTKSPATNLCQGSSATLTATNSGGTLSGNLSGGNYTAQQIQTVGTSTITSNITLPAGTITAASSITLTMNINHTYQGDLTATLISPSCGSSVIFNSPGGLFTRGDDLAGNYTFTSTSGTTFPDNNDPTTPQTYRATFAGITFPCASAAGTWTLKIDDNGNQDGGFLNNWTLSINTNGVYTSVFSGPPTISAVTYSGVTNTSATTTVTPPVGTNNYTVTTTDANGCIGTSAPVAIVVNPTPTLTGASLQTPVCANSAAQINLTGLVASSTATVTYKINGGLTQTVLGVAAFADGTASFNTIILTAANNGQPLKITGVTITSASPNCTFVPVIPDVTLSVKPLPTLTGATQQAPVCDGSSAQINLTGLVANSTSAITYTIGGGPTQTVTGVVATGSNASFNTIPLTFANNGQTLQITGITITSATPNCPQTFSQNVTLNVKVIPVLSSTLTPPPVCSGSTFTYTPTSATTGATFTWTRAAVTGITPATSSGTGTVTEVLTNTTSSPIIVTYKYITIANSCDNSPVGENVIVSVNPAPTIATATQFAASCENSGATIDLTGLLPGTTSTIYYVINNIAQTPITGVVSNAAGTASFVSANLTLANDGQILKITGISNTMFTPSCIKSVTVIALLSVTPVPTLTGASQASGVCVSGPATINLTGLVAGSLNNTIDYTINGIAQPAVTGVDADALGNASFNTSILTAANNGQTLIITGITSGACFKGFSQSFVLSVGSSYVWQGVNNDWFDLQNWCGGVPTITSDVLIPGSLLKYPILTTGIGYTHNITIQNTASVTVTGATLQIAGLITNNGTFDVTNGALEFNGAGPQTIPAGAFANNQIMDLIINNNVSLAGTDSITGNLSFSGSGKTFATNDNLVLKSTAAGTANVGMIINGNGISGKVSVERYMQAKRAWRFLSVPTNTTQTFHEAWQENMPQGSTTQTAPAGYGTQITNALIPTPANGFDYYSPDGPSVKKYDLTATGIYAPYKSINTTFDNMTTNEGIFTFVRGDRRSAGLGATPYPTILRTKGILYTGTQPTINVPANQVVSVGNPYASVLDMNTIFTTNATNLQEFFYLWDPNGTGPGNLGFGSFQTFFRTTDGNYHPTVLNGSYLSDPYKYIQSGQGFFMRSLIASPGSLTFTEQSKAVTPFSVPLVFRPAAGTVKEQLLRTRLIAVNADATADVVDGVVSIFGNEFSDSVDDLDAIKIANFSENLGIKNGEKILVVERRQTITLEDTIQLNILKMKVKSYRFELIGENFNQPGLTAFLEDSYLNTRTPIDIKGTTTYDFNVINVFGSYNPARFRIVFNTSLGGPLPVTFSSVKAYQKERDIAVEWKVENEVNIKAYEIEKSADGRQFTSAATIKATGSSNANYQWLDENPLNGANYYRIKSVDVDGKIKYSNVLKVVTGNTRSAIVVYPNPVNDGNINIQFINQPGGRYGIKLLNKLGQVIMIKEVERLDGSSSEKLGIKLLAHGTYQLEITKPDKSKTDINVLY